MKIKIWTEATVSTELFVPDNFKDDKGFLTRIVRERLLDARFNVLEVELIKTEEIRDDE